MGRRAVFAAGGAAVLTVAGLGVGRLLSGGRSVLPPSAQPAPSHASGQAAAAPTAPATVPPTKIGGGPVVGIRGKALLGAYLELSGLTLKQAFALRRKQLGRDLRIVHVFYDWTDQLPAGAIAGAPASAIPMISWRGTYHQGIRAGQFDAMIRANARRLARDGRPKFLRWGWEMNGNWYAWSGPKNDDDPAGYVDCWRRIHQIFTDEGVDNVSWVWSVNWNSAPDTAGNQFPAYYPGDQYVDWVAISGYNLHKEAPATLYDELYQRYAARKPMMISEVGSVEYGGSTKGDWVTEFAAYVESRPNIAAVCWFDTDSHRNGPETWRIDTNAHSLAEYKVMANGYRFSG